MTKLTQLKSVLYLVAAFTVYQGTSPLVHADAGGRTGYSGNPATHGGATCSSCHSGGPATTVSLSGPTSVAPNSTNAYTITITSAGQKAGGFDVSTTAGTLVAGTGSRLSTAEVVHSSPKSITGSSVSWQFNWTAPASGTATLYAAGLSTNGNGSESGDTVAKTSSLITVVSAANVPPVARPGGPYTGVAGQAVSFSGASSTDSDGTIAGYAWNFGDSTTGTGVSPNHTYAAAGTYNVSLTVTDNRGGTNTASTTATILTPNILPVAKPAGPYTGIAGIAILFNGASSTDSDGTIASYAWNFGDSATGTGKNPSHAYAAAGTYTVSLTVTDNRSGTNTATTTATISGSTVTLKNGTAVTAISGAAGSVSSYRITVPSAQTLLEIRTTGTIGDSDLDIASPSGATVKRLMNATSNEFVQVLNPSAGDWYIHLYGKTAYSNVTLLVKYSLATAVAAAPSGLAASDGTFDDKIVITWKPSAGATSYEVYRNTSNATSGTDFKLLGEVSDTIFEDSTAVANVIYYYFAKAKNPIGSSAFSTSNSGYLSNTPPTPGAVTASDGTYFDKIRVSWKLVPGATSYIVFRTQSATAIPDPVNNRIGETAALYFDDFGDDIVPQVSGIVKKYNYWIEAKNQNGTTGLSKTNDGSLSKKGPASVTASNGTYSSKITVTWAAVPGATSYDVYRYTDKTLLVNDATFAKITGTSYDDTSATKDVAYFYRVKAKYGSGNPVVYKYDSDFSPSIMGLATGSNNPVSTALANGVPSNAVGAMPQGSSIYFSFEVPVGTTRLVATLNGTPPPVGTVNDCDLLAKFANYPTAKSFGAKGVENKDSEILTVSNPAAGTWYFLLYGTTAYANVTLTVNCYSVADVVLTQVPLNDLAVPFTAVFKGNVVDETGAGIPNIVVLARNPITGLTSALTKTDAKGVFAYSALINSEGEHTFDFFFTSIPDNAKGTASHTVATRKGYIEPNGYFDMSCYLPAKPVATAGQADVVGLQNFLNTRNGWNEEAIDSTYETMWADSTFVAASGDTQLSAKLDSGLYLLFYGVEGAGVGNDTTPASAFSAVPFVVHVVSTKTVEVLANLKLLGLVDATQEAAIVSGKTGIVAVTSLSEPGEGTTPSNISLLASEQLELLAKLAGNTGTSGVINVTYSGVAAKQITVTFADGRKINVVGSGSVK